MIERFWVIVHDEMHRHRLGIAQNCESEIRQFIDQGMIGLRSNTSSPDDIRKAEENFRRFVQAMADDAVKKGYNELHEDTFAKAKSLFCPGMWPFC